MSNPIARDDFEDWLDSHKDEIFDLLPQQPRNLAGWLATFTRAAAQIANDQMGEDERELEDAFDEDDTRGIFGDEEP